MATFSYTVRDASGATRSGTSDAENQEILRRRLQEQGFTVVYPDELTFVEQVNLVANAKCIVAPEGSALFLCYFASPGTRLFILENAAVEDANVWRAFFPDCEPTAMAGTVVARDEGFPHRSSYRIGPQRFRDFLGEWL